MITSLFFSLMSYNSFTETVQVQHSPPCLQKIFDRESKGERSLPLSTTKSSTFLHSSKLSPLIWNLSR